MVVMTNMSFLPMTDKDDLGEPYPNFCQVHQLDVQGTAEWNNTFGSGSVVGGMEVQHHWRRC